MRHITIAAIATLCFLTPGPAALAAPRPSPPPSSSGLTLGLGARGGTAWSATEDAIENFPDTGFESGPSYKASLLFLFNRNSGLELTAGRSSMELKESGDDFGTLKLMPLTLLYKFQGLPVAGHVFGMHVDAGMGWVLARFEKGPFVRGLEAQNGVTFDIRTDGALFGELGLGLDFFVAKRFSFTLDGRWLLGNLSTSWNVVSGTGASLPLGSIHRFFASQVDGFVGFTVWFGRRS